MTDDDPLADELGHALNKSIGLESKLPSQQPARNVLPAQPQYPQSQASDYLRTLKRHDPQGLVNATNTDTDRGTREMQDTLNKLVAGYENDIRQANEVREIISKRINDLNVCLSAAKVSLEVISHRVDNANRRD